MRMVVCVLVALLASIACMNLLWSLVIQACDERGRFENNGTTYVCHKSPAPTGDNKE